MRIGFIQAINKEHLKRAHDIPSYSFIYLAAYLEKYLQMKDVFIADTVEELIEGKPDLVGVASYSMYFNMAAEIAGKVREALPGVPIVLGGHHIAAIPHTLPMVFDLAVRGEGEETFAELVTLFQRDRRFTPDNLDAVKGIVFHRNGETVISQHRPLIEPLDRIPFPKRELLKWDQKHDFLYSSRGCPYRCNFCSPIITWPKYRSHSVDHVITEIQLVLRQHDVLCIDFFDDLFIADLPRLKAISDRIVAEGLHKEVSFACTIRSNLMNDEICEILKKMNVVYCNFGAESGSDRILKWFHKSSKVEKIQNTLDLCHKYGIAVKASFIAFSPEETVEDLLATFRLIIRNKDKLQRVAVHPLIPLPGTSVWRIALERGLVTEDETMDWERLDGYFYTDKGLTMNNVIRKYDIFRFFRELDSLLAEHGLDWEKSLHSPNPNDGELIFNLTKFLEIIMHIYFPEKLMEKEPEPPRATDIPKESYIMTESM
ncbi:MAG: B12-binding domain-containing radical SAM protein [Armatimonadetes bacterium]|nr:B12-binding domain-containing radical SAM protein [Armatimonadota bacterium]